MSMTFYSLMRGPYHEKPEAKIEIAAEEPGTVVLQITSRDKTVSDYVEIRTSTLLCALIALGEHNAAEHLRHTQKAREEDRKAAR